ncbi:hypothetical protein GPK34_08675 [Secundilactobacillus kimchicus]|uniref:hypothetical protein n=1 Tax=Secundilactobacillus kimchicus TaxID=528209 RepID=UPI001C02C340|nr:hypothetical protein [Secundilactobacillus kimchicus]MBT9672102.1 hypothetical protein [Secundilactobacillus kimchicus]
MYYPDDRPTGLGQIILLCISILINSLGNALTVSLNLGSALWTASAVNLGHLFSVSLGNMLLFEGIAVILANALLLRSIDWHRMIGNLIFMIPFSYLVGGLTRLLVVTGIQSLPTWLAVIIDVVGVMMIGAGISIYQRINIVLHPNDDLMQILRFRYLHGNPIIAQFVAYLPPIILIVSCFFISQVIWAVNVGTLVSLLFQGTFIGISDRLLFPRLKHQKLFQA